MFADRISANDLVRVVIALGFCGLLLVSDLNMPVEMNEAQLYPLALLPLYRVKIKHILPIFAILAIGFIVAGHELSPEPDFWDGITTRIFSVLLVVMTAIGLGRLSGYERKLLTQSLTDPLTGLLKRRSFMEFSNKEEARTKRRGSALSVLMLDIDHFKRINDTYGHPVGDIAIKTLATICSKMLRPTDILARWVGEKFVISLPETDAESAKMVAERLRRAVAGVMIPIEGGSLQFTVSFGVSTFTKGEHLSQAIERADQALHRAKHNGRNRVESDDTLAQDADAA